jgi:hypothetical protein
LAEAHVKRLRLYHAERSKNQGEKNDCFFHDLYSLTCLLYKYTKLH